MTEPNRRERPQVAPGGAHGPVTVPAALLAVSTVDRNAWRDHVWAADDLKGTDKLVALAFAEHASRTTTAVWVAPERLERMTGLGRTAAKAAVRRLVTAGWLVVSEPARQRRAPRYALLVPSRTDGAPRVLLDAVDNALRVSDSDTLRLVQGVASRQSEPPRVSEYGTRVSESDTEPLPNPTPTTPAREAGDDLAGIRARQVRELVGVIHDKHHRLANGLGKAALRAIAEDLRQAGWSPETLATSLAPLNFTNARHPGLLLHKLRDLAADGPPLPATAASARRARSTCPVHGDFTGTCTGCAGDHRAGEHLERPSSACHLCAARRPAA